MERIRQTGALIIGTYDRFSYGDHKDENKVIFVGGTGHVYTEREQFLADTILGLVKEWQ